MARRKEAGQALIFGVVTLGLLLMGFAGLGIDMGYLRYQKRLQQAAADSAAIAGASDLPAAFGGITLAAQNAAKTSGFTDASSNNVGTCTGADPHSAALVGTVCVQVNNPPSSGPHATGAGNTNYVEVLVSVVQPTFFMKVLHILGEPVTARAVATTVGGGTASGCLYTLGNPANGVEGVNIQGSAILDAPTCGIIDDGNFNTKGNKLTVNSGTFGIAGDWDKSGPGGSVTCAGSPNCPTTTNMPPAGDPLAGLVTAPAVGAPVAFDSTNIVPGSTYNGISIPANKVVTFPAGTYIVSGNNFSIPANSTVLGTGVTFYFTNGATISVVGTPDIKLSAPDSGQYTGVLFYQDPNDTNTNGPSLGGDSASFFQGALYFPSDNLTFFGNGTFNSGAQYTMVIAGSLTLSGNPDVVLNSNYSGLPNGLSIIKNAVLVE